MIFKIQRSLFSSGGATMLIYNKSRSVMGQLPLSKDVEKLLKGDVKGYFTGKVDRGGLLHIKGRVPNQNW